jgi:hypothetical protein
MKERIEELRAGAAEAAGAELAGSGMRALPCTCCGGATGTYAAPGFAKYVAENLCVACRSVAKAEQGRPDSPLRSCVVCGSQSSRCSCQPVPDLHAAIMLLGPFLVACGLIWWLW